MTSWELCLDSLDGLSVGDALGAQYLVPGRSARDLRAGRLPDPVLGHIGDSQVRRGVERARRLLGVSVAEAAHELGNGARALASDTVPFALWTAATWLDDYPSAILACVEAGGDVDTTAAIVGGVVATYTGRGATGVPAAWLRRREPLPELGTWP